ncbi:hypothetical protein H5410_004298 [Solanum commersonii]|uniref:Uncharacterized protein n=1 Tax=Solanum commersonii TaxID=4109 RepID=A0A9J6B707_SOLCO|nr:hypothetical protein H5410_004298 [Solanum commersonii]
MVIVGAEGHHNVGIQLAREMNHNFLGCAENSLGICEWLESKGHQYIVTPEKEGPDCGTFIPYLHVLISTPFYPTYVTTERIKKAKIYDLAAGGIGSDHVDHEVAATLWIGDARSFGSTSCLDSRIKMDSEPENQIGAKFEEDLDKMMSKCDIVDLMEMFGTHNQLPRTICGATCQTKL